MLCFWLCYYYKCQLKDSEGMVVGMMCCRGVKSGVVDYLRGCGERVGCCDVDVIMDFVDEYCCSHDIGDDCLDSLYNGCY